MSSLFSNWPKAVFLSAVLSVGCSGSSDEWPLSEAIDDGGFSVRMPVASGAQNGTILLGSDTVSTHINILADSGITYASSWFRLPERWGTLTEAQTMDSLWPLIVERIGGTPSVGPGPVQQVGNGVRGGWFVNASEIRLGVVVHLMGDRAVVMNAATPAPFLYRARRTQYAAFP
jgi:hypothetical protein